jgi:hypothetical protein
MIALPLPCTQFTSALAHTQPAQAAPQRATPAQVPETPPVPAPETVHEHDAGGTQAPAGGTAVPAPRAAYGEF